MQTTRLRQFAHAHAARAERRASLQRCEELLRDLPPIPPGSMHALCQAIRTPDGLPIRVHQMPIPPHGPAALLAAFPDEYVIVVDSVSNTGRFARRRRLAHEVSHIALGHCTQKLSAADQRALWFPDLDSGFVARATAFTPCYYPTQKERDADALAARLLAAVLRGRVHKQADGAPEGEAVPLLGGGRDDLLRHYWLLRPLHVELVTAVPDAALFPPSSILAGLLRVSELEHRVIRQVIEILDVWGFLQDRQDPTIALEVASIARKHAYRARLPNQHSDATVQAAVLAAAARTVRDGGDTPPTRGGVACAASVDAHAELARLGLVAAAFKGPACRAALAEYFG